MDFKKKPILAMIHCSGQQDRVVDRALEEIRILKEEGVDGIIVENYHGDIRDVQKILHEIQPDIRYPEKKDMIIGINILPNEYHRAIPMANTYGADFVQLDHVAGIYQRNTALTVEGYTICRNLFPDVKVLGGVWPKYYEPIKGSVLEDDIKEGMNRADAIVVTGTGTGQVTPLDKIKQFRSIMGKYPLIIGAGLTPSNVSEQLIFADGVIVGSCLKPYGRTQEMIKRDLVKEFMDEVNKVR